MCNIYYVDRQERSIQRMLDDPRFTVERTGRRGGGLLSSMKMTRRGIPLHEDEVQVYRLMYKWMVFETEVRQWVINIILLCIIVIAWIAEKLGYER